MLRDDLAPRSTLTRQGLTSTHPKHRLGELPAEASETVLLTRRIFAQACDDGFRGGYWGGVIHFGVSYKGIEGYWEDWLNEFESLLSRLYWESAVVQMDNDERGRHRFEWHVSNEEQEAYWLDLPGLPRRWEFDGPFRHLD
jgi:hypothetical protein